ncbi:acetyltransferase [Brassicibacter mesophilus]|uniref:acetyltransferase n=1 Tax=Brassicibacter mesophilus TaxID=745119 RepID=UPI003D25C50A
MKIAIFGISGFPQEVRDIAFILGYKEIVFIDKTKQEKLGDFPVVAEGEVYTLVKTGYKFAIGIGNPKIRKDIRERYPDLNYVNLIHPTATFGYGQLEEVQKSIGNIICAGVRMTNNIKIGNFGIYNLNCTIGHECIIEDFVTISPGANISGNVKLSSGSYIGSNACILQGKSITEKMIIGKNSIVGAGAVVTKNISDHKIVKGSPAK